MKFKEIKSVQRSAGRREPAEWCGNVMERAKEGAIVITVIMVHHEAEN